MGTLMMTLIFIIEVYVGSLSGTAGYILIVFCLLWYARTRLSLIIVGAISTVFLISALLLHFAAIEEVAVVINRILSVVAIWMAITFTFRFNRLYEQQRTKSGQLHALFDNANEGILFADNSGKIILTNPFLERMFGYQRGELAGHDIQALTPEKYQRQNARYLQKYIRKPLNRPVTQEFWAIHADGHEFPAEISLSHFYDKGELFIIAFILDITEKKKHQQMIEANFSRIRNYNIELEDKVKQRTLELEHTNQALQKSQHLYKSMAHYFPDGIMGVLDKEVRYLLVDGQDLKTTRSGDGVAIDNELLGHIRSAIMNYAAGAVGRVFKGENLSFDTAVNDKIYNITVVPIPGNNQVNEVFFVAKNITSQKQLEQDLIKNLEREKELSLLKSRFVTMASHEFRTPLTTILSSAFLMEHYTGKQLDTEKTKHLGRIKRAVQGLTDLLNDFLSLGKLEEGKVHAVYSEINLQQFFEDLLQEIDLLKKDGQNFRFEFLGEIKELMTDRYLLRNIVVNLLSNAIKYSPASSDIEVIAAVTGKQITIQVTDHGIGIPEDEHRHIFTRFFRAQNVNEIQGTGLGLNIVKKHVKLLNGNIDFISRLNEGTTFTVNLPLVTNETNLTKTKVLT
ncbi:sensor histidine kinase [Fulvivirga imtechensis]|nr:PAS domain-containing sensor histidine kinase [Fulvivirga imtechensis]